MLPSCLLLECPDPARIHDAKENHGSSRLRQDRRCQRLNRRLLSQFGTPKTPPRVPRSTIMPFRQTKGSRVGRLVVGFSVVFVYENPATSPLSFTKTAQLSLPPSVPRSRITPFCQRNACTCVAKKGVNGWKQNPNESGIFAFRGRECRGIEVQSGFTIDVPSSSCTTFTSSSLPLRSVA